jgi:esterase/lipase superfamily enzyme
VKKTASWYSARVEREVRLVRWGHFGTPVLVFPTAGGDDEEIERFGLIQALAPLLGEGRIKVYSIDSLAGRAWLMQQDSAEHCTWLQNQYDALIYHEILPAIRTDCASDTIEIITAGASIGAFNALASLCRHPDAVRAAIGMSGSYDLSPYLHGRFSEAFHHASPWHFLPDLDGPELDRLRGRFALFTFGQGRWETPSETWHMAHLLGSKKIPNRVDPWGHEWDHDWPTWRAQLPHYLAELA